jgi:hypothetical protein
MPEGGEGATSATDFMSESHMQLSMLPGMYWLEDAFLSIAPHFPGDYQRVSTGNCLLESGDAFYCQNKLGQGVVKS